MISKSIPYLFTPKSMANLLNFNWAIDFAPDLKRLLQEPANVSILFPSFPRLKFHDSVKYFWLWFKMHPKNEVMCNAEYTDD